MENIYPMLIAFFMIFVSELGDKTQILVMSFSGKQKIVTILLGVALGTFFSHGLAILFGSYIGAINNENVKLILDFATNIIFLSILSSKKWSYIPLYWIIYYKNIH